MSATASISLESLVKSRAYALGFDLAGIASLGEVESAPHFERWLESSYAGEMHYLERSIEKRGDTRKPLDGAKTAVVVALDYGGRSPTGPVARYARGDDYHDLMLERLTQLHRDIETEVVFPVFGKAYVDTGPILERDLARKAGLGWFGKNTNLLNPQTGSFFFIGCLLLDLDLRVDSPFESDHCGSCRRCMDACPTGALVDDRVLDATKCISYLTIELKTAIPEALRPAMGTLLYGCDICQDVCPWNAKFSRTLKESALGQRSALDHDSPGELAHRILGMDAARFESAFRNSPMKRAKLRGLKRNAAVVLGNIGDSGDIPVLEAALDGAEPLVDEHVDWAIRQIQARA